MGEYITYLNLDKKEKVHLVPYKFAENMIGEQPKLLLWLLTHNHDKKGLGWGDVNGFKYLGRWAGDRIIVLGDYDPLYQRLKVDEEFKDITCEVAKEVMEYAEKEELEDLYKYLKDSYEIQCVLVKGFQ